MQSLRSENGPSSSLPYQRRTYLLKRIIVILGVFTAALGVMVLAGWYTHNNILIQVLPSLVPMQYNTALGFVLCGIGLIALAYNRYHMALILSALLGSIAVLTLVQYTFGVNLGLDELFMDHYITTKSSHPGRMAPTTAFSFLLTATVLLVPIVRIVPARRLLVLGFLCSLIFALGAGTLLVYLTGFDRPTPYGFTSSTYMAVHTSIGFALIGTGVFLYILCESFKRQRSLQWLPATVFFSVLWLTLGLWNALKIQEIYNMELALQRRTNNIDILFREGIESYGKTLINMAKRWESHDIISKQEWQFDAKNLLDTDSAFMALAWIDLSFRVRWIETDNDTASYQAKPEPGEPLRQAMESARTNHRLSAEYYNGLTRKDSGVAFFAPIYSKDNFDGWIMGIIDLQEKFQHVLGGAKNSNFAYELYSGNHIIYAGSISEKQAYEKFAPDIEFTLYGESWRLRVFPTPALISSFQTPLPYIILVLGMIISIFLPLTILLYQKSDLNAKKLELEATERKKLHNELEKNILEKELILNTAGEGIYGLDINGNTTFVNPAAAQMIEWKVENILGKSQHDVLHHSKPDGTPYPKEQCPIYAAYKDGKTHHVEDEVFWKKDGTSFPVEYTSAPVRDETGELTGAVVTFRDISERKRRDDLLRESEKKFRKVIENSPDAIVMADREGKIVLINPQTEKLFGYSSDELIGKTVEILMPDSFRKRHEKHRQNYHSHPSLRPMGEGYDLYALKKDGTVCSIEISLSPLETDEGDMVLATVRDITERKKQDDLLRESEERFRGAFANSAIGMALVSPEGKWMKVNDALCNIVGYSEEELLSTDFQTMTHPDDLEADIDRVRRMLEGEIEIYHIEKRYIHKQGQAVWILLNVSLVHDSEGNPLYFISQIQDITRRKKAEEALNETLAQLSKKSQYESIISDVTRSVHSSINLEDVLENAVQSIHENLTDAGGVAIYLVEGNIAKIKAHTGFPDWFIDQVREIPYPKGYTWKTITEGEQFYCDDVDRDNAIGPAGRKVGTKSYVSTPIRHGDKVIGCININSQEKNAFSSDCLNMHEIIARQIEVAIDNAKQAKEMQDAHENLRTTTQMLIQAEKMSAVGTMVAGVAHELNNPLMGVLNSIQMSLKYTSEDDRRYRYLSIGNEATKRCIEIVANLLTFSYDGDNARGQFRRECCRQILQSVLELINYRIVKHNVNMIQDIDDGNLEVWMKSNNIKQVLLNLISNAIDASENCERKEIRIGMKRNDNHVEIVVEDNGGGIAPEELGRIFDPFFTTKPVGKGTGLALSITRNIINEHNGDITCESRVGTGTKFTILLPIERRTSA